ncbi:hypothetical protein SAMN06265365_107220 [Tistlia consotensis]|uniref:4-amino-4-deoxy-L-arabinose transferase n=1 Tax=Tistlia consotensis USBA 355 TaxID=560819 RepID=A0A1Y6BDX3_9PROT|nr:hypothetical protein [Tistlia consotensis]SME98901.1 hypothetical protein SAMN05428998_102222 [Tistlia consotensis USBA 355]SNR58376.1 hypothetical protein SAMN06265365_107220 [Tistlia consotensis]
MASERRARPAWPLAPAALFTLFVADLVFAVLLAGQSEMRENLGYLLLLLVGPFAGGLIWLLCERRDPQDWESRARQVLLLASLTQMLLALGGLAYQQSDLVHDATSRFLGVGLRPTVHGLMLWILPAFLLLSLLALADRLPAPAGRLLTRLEPWAVPLLIAGMLPFCAVFTPLYQPNDTRISAFFDWAQLRPPFVTLLLVAWPLAWLLPRLPAVRRGLCARLLLALVLVFGLLLYDDGFFVEYSHYMPYVGPALHALHGGVPMVEVYSQYGILPWVLLWVGYHWLPETYGSAAVIVRLFTVAWYLTLPLTVYRLTRNKPAAMLLSATGLLWVIGFHADALDMNGMPSTQGYRYLLPSLAVAWLAWVPGGRRRDLGMFLLMVVGSLWSIETAAFVAGPPVALALLVSIRDRRIGPLLRQALLVLAGVVVGHAALALYLQAAYGRWPDYGPFFELLGFFKPAEGEASHWSAPMPYGFGLWVPFAGVLFVALAVPVRDAFLGRVRHPRAWSLIPATVLAIGELTYFVGRTYSTTLGLALMPFLVVCLVGFDALIERWRGSSGRPVRAERLLVALAIAGCFAFFAERFQRPFDAGASNATILRHCFTEAGCSPGAVARRVVEAVEERNVDIRLEDQKNFVVRRSDYLERLKEVEALLRRHFAGQERVGLLADTARLSYLGIAALDDLDKWFLWPISSPTNDGESPSLARRTVESATPRDGELLIVARDDTKMAAIVAPLTEKYRTRCRLTPVEEGNFYAVVRTSDCHD